MNKLLFTCMHVSPVLHADQLWSICMCLCDTEVNNSWPPAYVIGDMSVSLYAYAQLSNTI
jgi:hypothetical protein